MAYTKGPWVVKFQTNIFSESGRLVANCGGYSDNSKEGIGHEENLANTRLIQQCPELLEALQEMVKQFGGDRPSDWYNEFQWRAIEKAKGIINKAINI